MDTDSGRESMLNHPQMDSHNPLLNKYPLNLNLIYKYEQLYTSFSKALKEYPRLSTSSIFGIKLIRYQLIRLECHCIVIPVQLQYPVIRWLRNILRDTGMTRVTSTLTAHFWFPQIFQMINSVVNIVCIVND